MPELDEEGNAALIQHPVSSIEHQPQSRKHSSSEKNRYGTRKILSVYGSFTSVPGGNPSTSTYLPGE
jgi:hypothetical protein